MALPQRLFEVCKQKPNNRATIKQQQQHRLAIHYQPTIWSHDYIQVLDDSFPIDFKERVGELEKKTVMKLNGSFSMLELLEDIDDIERLGLGYRFKNDIRRALDRINHVELKHDEVSLHEATLRFKILRQHGYNVSQDFLRRFKDSRGRFIGCMQTDVKGLLSLYEASHLAFMEESDLHEARLFATRKLLKLKSKVSDRQALEHIKNALEVPLFHRMPRLQARCYIDAYTKRQDANLILLELATLDFNMNQATYKAELKEVSKWWENTRLPHNLGFVRDRLMECFFWTVGIVFEPRYHSCRTGLTKVGTLITVIDDIYDVYGSFNELEMFTDVVKRWDINAMQHMPKYLQLAFVALFNLISEIGSKSSNTLGEDITPILVKVWGELFEAFLVEAKWTHDKHIPTLEIYLDNAWRSISGEVILTHGYILINQETKKDVFESLEKYHGLMKWSSMIFRLYNDLATSSHEIERGKTVNAISCYMHETGVCEEVARAYVSTLIEEAWRKLIREHVVCSQELANPVIDMAINLARISRCVYQYGDGHGAPDARAKDRVLSVLIEPIAIREKELIYA